LPKALALARFCPNVKLLTLIDVEQEGRRLRLMQLVEVAQFRGIEQVAQGHWAVHKIADPTRLQLCPGGIDCIELPSAQKRLDQRVGPVVCELCYYFLATEKSKVQSDASISRWMMPLPLLNKFMSELPGQSRHALPTSIRQ
jgi:hypothetical protein